jgi:hypothetical protein
MSLFVTLQQLIDRTLVAMGAKRRQECKFDAYLLSYPTGSLIPAHTDVLDREKYPTGCHRYVIHLVVRVYKYDLTD